MEASNPRLGSFVETAIAGERVKAFVPPPLPPNPPISTRDLLSRLSKAERALGKLDGVSMLLPNKELFLYMYVRKEAVLSSQIEGTQSTLTDLLQYETETVEGKPIDDVREVSNYVDALMYGLERLETLPLSLRLIREMHEKLLNSARGSTKNPGAFRTTQNWIGGTRPGNALFVPPPPEKLAQCLDAFEKFIHQETPEFPPLIKAGLLHVQFETIHPFLDGNGRLGRLLITLFLCLEKVLNAPLLYLSLYFKEHRADYYRLLQEVREQGNWEAWLEFFLEGVEETANKAVETANRIANLFEQDRKLVGAEQERTKSALQIYELLRTKPYITASTAAKETELTIPTVNAAFEQLQKLKIVTEVTGKKRDRVYSYKAYLDLLNEGAQPLEQ